MEHCGLAAPDRDTVYAAKSYNDSWLYCMFIYIMSYMHWFNLSGKEGATITLIPAINN